MSEPATAVTLRALEGTPLADANIRDVVVATTNSIGERNAVEIRAINTDSQSITVSLIASRLVALGFAVELRRVTDLWFRKKTGRSLWGEPRVPGDEWEI